MIAELTYPFTEEESRKAYDEWGANCGPNALAVCLNRTLNDVRPAMTAVAFVSKYYTSPTMMKGALAALGLSISRTSVGWAYHGLVRIQWTGPWTKQGSNPRWAYGQTHWVHSRLIGKEFFVFDCNGGWRTAESWEQEIVPLITQSIKRADGGWYITHSWEVKPCA